MSHGLQSDEFNFRAFYQSAEGEMFFGGLNGFNAFFPERIETPSYVPPVVLTSFMKMNQPVELSGPIFEVETVSLDYRDRVVSFDFAVLDYTAPGKNRYAYKLEGLADDWIELGAFRRVNLTNLDSREYVLRVKGASSSGIWNEAKPIILLVGPPPWLKPWVICTLACAKTWAAYQHLPKWARTSILPAFYLFLLTAIWLLRPALLARWSMPSHTQPEMPKWRLGLQLVILIRGLGGTQRALDAWLRIHDPVLFQRCFEAKPVVRTRKSYVDLGNEQDLAAWDDNTRAGRPVTCWIAGPGGCGKSTLAFEMARRRREATTILPVVVAEDWSASLVRHLGDLLHIEDRRPTERMIQRLTHTGRLLVLVDGLSERRIEKADQQLADLIRQGIFRHLLVTSRNAPTSDLFREIRVGPLDSARLPRFVAAYHGEADIESLVTTLSTLTKGEPIRPLFARLAILHLQEHRDMPASYPELVQAYVHALRPRGLGALADDDFLRAARVAAEACVIEELAPRAVNTESVRLLLHREDMPFCNDNGDELPVKKVLDQLLRCGLLESLKEHAVTRVRFSEDPIAEYLYAMHVVEQGEAQVRKLRKKLQRCGERARGLADAFNQLRFPSDARFSA